MAYCIYSDISSEFKNTTFTASSAITSSEVTEFIAQEESIINATISNRYETPITGTESLKILKRISIAYVAYRVAKILNLKKDLPIPEKLTAQDLSEGASFRLAKNLLADIQKGRVILPDATALTAPIKSYTATNSIVPVWERDTKQW